MKKALVIGIVVLFIGTSAISSAIDLDIRIDDKSREMIKQTFISTMQNGNILYVGGNGEGNYTKIQDAIDNASNGDTVFVFSGIYNEKLWIRNQINLIGEDTNTTIIDGSNFSHFKGQVNILSDWVNFSCFSIKNLDFGTALYLCNVSNVNVTHNNIKAVKSYSAVNIGISSDITLFDNIIWNSKHNHGLDLGISNRQNIEKNIFTGNRDGIYSYDINDSNICNNYFFDNTQGLNLYRFHNGTITENIIENNSGYGISLERSYNNIILRNVITENLGTGISVKGSSRDNTVTDNIVKNNKNGIVISNTDKSTVTLNEIMGNSEAGISIRSPNTIVTKNNLIKNNPNADFRFSGIYNMGRLPIRGFFQGLKDSFTITFNNNFWNRNITQPVLIKGTIVSECNPAWGNDVTYKWWKFDWHPATEPYDIGI